MPRRSRGAARRKLLPRHGSKHGQILRTFRAPAPARCAHAGSTCLDWPLPHPARRGERRPLRGISVAPRSPALPRPRYASGNGRTWISRLQGGRFLITQRCSYAGPRWAAGRRASTSAALLRLLPAALDGRRKGRNIPEREVPFRNCVALRVNSMLQSSRFPAFSGNRRETTDCQEGTAAPGRIDP